MNFMFLTGSATLNSNSALWTYDHNLETINFGDAKV